MSSRACCWMIICVPSDISSGLFQWATADGLHGRRGNAGSVGATYRSLCDRTPVDFVIGTRRLPRGRARKCRFAVDHKLFNYIVAYKRAHDGNSPTLRQMMQGIGVNSTSVVHSHLRGLERAGLIRRVKDCPRSIQVIGGRWEWRNVRESNGRLSLRAW